VYWGLEATIRGQSVPAYNQYGEVDLGALLAPLIPQFIVTTLLVGAVALVARWVYYALAISGLRGGEITSGWLIGRGLRALGADLLVLVAGTGLTGALFGVGVATRVDLALLLALFVLPVLIYLEVRLAFWPLVIFDGAGIFEGLAAAWRASAGGAGRMFGWALAVAGVGFLVNIGVAIVTAPLGGAIPLQSGLKAGVTEAYAVFQLFTLAVIYESQLRRTMPERASPPPASGFTEPARAWPGYAPADPGYAAPPWTPPGPAPTTTPPAGPGAAWDVPPINPDAPDDWDAAQRGVPAPGDPPADAPPLAPPPAPPSV
jgi:hypothetical protein